MNRIARALPILLAALLLSPAAAGWSQPGGNASRAQAAAVASGPLDILGHAPLGDERRFLTFLGMGAVETPHGLVAVVADADVTACDVVRLPDPLGELVPVASLEPCGRAELAAYDAASDTLILCHAGAPSTVVVEARDAASGARRWALTGQDVHGLPGASSIACSMVAVDEGAREIFVPFEVCCEVARNVLTVIDATSGAVERQVEIPAEGTESPLNMPVWPPGSAFARREYYRGITLTSTGVVLTGFALCVAACGEGVVSWFDRELLFHGKERAVTADPARVSADSLTRYNGVSRFGAAQGPTAAVLLGRDVLIVNPELDAPAQRAEIGAISPNSFRRFAPQAFWTSGGMLVVPLSTSLTAIDAATLEPRWSWAEGLDLYLSHVLLTNGGQAIATTESPSEGSVALAFVDLSSGRPAITLPLPFTASEEQRADYASTLLPLRDGRLLFMDDDGNRVLLGAADPATLPKPTLSDLYPRPGAEVVLQVEPGDAGAQQVLVVWGPDEEERFYPSEKVRHVFTERGDVDIRVVTLHADGTTRSAVLTVHVGAAPPPGLSALQKAFSADNQNWTFFFLGLAVTVLGVAFTVGRQRRRFNKLERELAAVEEIRMMSVEDPRAAVVALKAYRDRLPHDLSRGRIDDSQYQVLDIRSARLLKVLRTRMFAPYDARMSMRYHRLLDAAFEDAILQPSERNALVRALEDEGELRYAERVEIISILDDFTSARVDAPATR